MPGTSAFDVSASDQIATIGGLRMHTHDHLCVLYRGEDQRDELMVELLAEGVRAGSCPTTGCCSFWDAWGTATYERDGVPFARIGADMTWANPLVGATRFIMDLAR